MVKQHRSWSAGWLMGALAGALTGGVSACNVTSAPATTGGVMLDGGGSNSTAPYCPSALDVASSMFSGSTNISVLSPAGAVLSASIISSGSADPGLTTALSSDVVFPLAPTPGRIVLIDRSSSVLTWVDPASAKVLYQMPVGTGFDANPYDYLAVSDSKAYVARYASNMSPGQQPNDGGGDLLIVDPRAVTTAGTTAITGRVAFAADAPYFPSPARMLRVGGEVWVSLQRWDGDYMNVADARLAGVSATDDSIAWTLDLPGVANCSGMDLAPSGKVVALSCTGGFSDTPALGRSSIVLLDATAHPPVELRRIGAATQLGGPLGFSLAFAAENLLLGTVLGDSSAGRNDLAFTADVAAGTATVLVDSGAPFVLGDLRCSPGCTDLCFLADAQANALRVWKLAGGALAAQPAAPVDPTVQLPPVTIGAF